MRGITNFKKMRVYIMINGDYKDRYMA